MAHIITEKETFRLTIFVILFPEEKSFFISKTKEGNLKQTYKKHFYGERARTKDLFMRARQMAVVPPMYSLESLETTEKNAFLHCIAWAKYFSEQGLTSCCGESINQHTNELKKECKKIYEKIESKNLSEVCPPGKDLFPNFGRIQVKNETPKKNIISFRVTKKEYEHIQNAAAELSVTPTDYCKKMIRNGCAVIVDPEVFNMFSKYINEFVKRDQLLKGILSAIYSMRVYSPADLDIIQQAIRENADQQKQALNEVRAILKELNQ